MLVVQIVLGVCGELGLAADLGLLESMMLCGVKCVTLVGLRL